MNVFRIIKHWVDMFRNIPEWVNMFRNSWNWIGMFRNTPNWMNMFRNIAGWMKILRNTPRLSCWGVCCCFCTRAVQYRFFFLFQEKGPLLMNHRPNWQASSKSPKRREYWSMRQNLQIRHDDVLPVSPTWTNKPYTRFMHVSQHDFGEQNEIGRFLNATQASHMEGCLHRLACEQEFLYLGKEDFTFCFPQNEYQCTLHSSLNMFFILDCCGRATVSSLPLCI